MVCQLEPHNATYGVCQEAQQLCVGLRSSMVPSGTTLRLITHYVCAVSRLMISPVQPGRTEREVLGAPNRPEIERWRGKEPVMESGGQQKTCMLRCRKLRVLWLELDCPKPNLQGSSCPPIDTRPGIDALLRLGSYVRPGRPLQKSRWSMRSLKGMSGRPTACSDVSSGRNTGSPTGASLW
jgi:hypothetical protein